MQADGKRDMERNSNRGDAGDPFPGTSNNKTFNATSNPNSKSYANADSCVAVTTISASGATMTAQIQVKCLGGGHRPTPITRRIVAEIRGPPEKRITAKTRTMKTRNPKTKNIRGRKTRSAG